MALLTRTAIAQEERVGQVQQPITNGIVVLPALQHDLGLVTVGGGCSGTLVNRYWVLTADHCVTTDGTMGGPSAEFSNVRISAVWASRIVTPTRFVRNFFSDGRDVALIFLGDGDFGVANTQLFFVGQVSNELTLTKYGRGIFQFATGTDATNAVPAQQDGQYRVGTQFKPSNSDAIRYSLAVNAANQVGNGGDSGGPDIATAPDGISRGITGVQSTCNWTGRVPGMPNPPVWTWVTGIRSCTSAAIDDIRFEIVQTIQERPAPAIYGVTPNDDLLLYRHDGRNDGSFRWAFSEGRKVGVGEGNFKQVFSGGDGVIYAITDNGDLMWYRDDGSFRWAFSEGKKVGAGRGNFKQCSPVATASSTPSRPEWKLACQPESIYREKAKGWGAPGIWW